MVYTVSPSIPCGACVHVGCVEHGLFVGYFVCVYLCGRMRHYQSINVYPDDVYLHRLVQLFILITNYTYRCSLMDHLIEQPPAVCVCVCPTVNTFACIPVFSINLDIGLLQGRVYLAAIRCVCGRIWHLVRWPPAFSPFLSTKGNLRK